MTTPHSDDRIPVFYTADLCLFSGRAGIRYVLVIKRGWPPFQGRWALPGGHVEADETSRDAAAREGAEETGVTTSADALTLVGVFDTPERDPRGRYVTVAWSGLLADTPTPSAGDDAHDAQWMPVTALLNAPDALAFDHHQILIEAFRLLLVEEATEENVPQ